LWRLSTQPPRQQSIARLVAELVVDELEPVDVEDRVAQRLAVPLPTLMLLGEPLLVRVAACAPVSESISSRFLARRRCR
jgi:hypothetical protein